MAMGSFSGVGEALSARHEREFITILQG